MQFLVQGVVLFLKVSMEILNSFAVNILGYKFKTGFVTLLEKIVPRCQISSPIPMITLLRKQSPVTSLWKCAVEPNGSIWIIFCCSLGSISKYMFGTP